MFNCITVSDISSRSLTLEYYTSKDLCMFRSLSKLIFSSSFCTLISYWVEEKKEFVGDFLRMEGSRLIVSTRLLEAHLMVKFSWKNYGD